MQRRSMLLAGFALVLTLCLPLSSAASTEATWHPDGDDSPSPLDIRRAGMVVESGLRVTISIRTFERIDLASDGQLWAHLDSWGGPRWDYGFHIWYDGGSSGIYCDWRDRKGHVNPLIAWSVRGRTASCSFDARQIAIRKPVRWRVFSTTLLDRSPVKPRPSDMLDRAPNGGAWFPGVELPDR